MKPVSATILNQLWLDFDAREDRLREVVAERLAQNPPPQLDDAVVASYFFAFRQQTLTAAVAEISYHATSGIKNPPPGSLLEECSATAAGIDPFDASERIGLLHIAFPLKMLLQPDGHLTSVDLLHTAASAVIFDMYENMDARLLRLEIPERVLRTFPGPAHGPHGLRQLTGFAPDQPAFGTILKPTAGITPDDVEFLVGQAAPNPLFMFIKEDENLYPNLDYSPVAERTRRAMAAIERAREQRGGLGLIFAPHITGAPHEILDSVHAALDAGATGLMFSETFAGGIVRMVREATKERAQPPALYGHNAGIGVKTRGIWREVIDFLARLDGIDFRQTAPLKSGAPFIRPYGAEWLASEQALSQPLPGINPTMITRAGGLDQGNIGLNLADVAARGLTPNVLFLAGSAINSVKNEAGKADPRVGAAAMQEAVEVYRSGELAGVPLEEYVPALKDVAARRGLAALKRALAQRYPA
ncbi:MAG: 2,3-diketo-5-methylthiopentyl-1-phosphate enolase [Anaerolineae bacterium]|nr:2,3-diketo-5-methylthiopentyl-1-phosphate enolase [Anaerolineae bacterium]